MTDEDDTAPDTGPDAGPDTASDTGLTRPQRRLLRRLYNGRTEPIRVDGKEFLTFRDASRHLLALADDAREAAYLEMKRQAGQPENL